LAKVSVDTARQAAGAPVRAFAARADLQRAQGVREAIDTLASRSAEARARRDPLAIFAGCYELVVDSALKDSSIPRRFALAPLSPDTAENVVHAVTSDGRMGGVILGSRWTQLSSNTIKVQFPALDKPHSATIRLGLEAKSFNRSRTTTETATIVVGQDQALLTVHHESCRP
jgi:hypothetical protein